MSGANSARAYAAFARSTSKQLREGELVLVHCNSYADGYWTDVTRTYCLGEPDERQREMYGAVLAARDAVLAAIAPGVRAADVDAAARNVIASRGFGAQFRHSTGHGVGFAAIDAGAQPRLHPASPDVLLEGMVCNVSPRSTSMVSEGCATAMWLQSPIPAASCSRPSTRSSRIW